MDARLSGVYGITSADFGMSHEDAARAFLEGGIRIVQYREKGADARTMIKEASRIKEMCREKGALFIIDDRIDVAVAVDSDGVHIGQDDVPISVAKRIFPGKIIGVSAKTPGQALEAERNGADYLGVGALFPTTTKVKTHVIGFDGFSAVRRSTKLPVFAIGGMKAEHIKQLKGHGSNGVAVISAILGAKDPVASAREFVSAWNGT